MVCTFNISPYGFAWTATFWFLSGIGRNGFKRWRFFIRGPDELWNWDRLGLPGLSLSMFCHSSFKLSSFDLFFLLFWRLLYICSSSNISFFLPWHWAFWSKGGLMHGACIRPPLPAQLCTPSFPKCLCCRKGRKGDGCENGALSRLSLWRSAMKDIVVSSWWIQRGSIEPRCVVFFSCWLLKIGLGNKKKNRKVEIYIRRFLLTTILLFSRNRSGFHRDSEHRRHLFWEAL